MFYRKGLVPLNSRFPILIPNEPVPVIEITKNKRVLEAPIQRTQIMPLEGLQNWWIPIWTKFIAKRIIPKNRETYVKKIPPCAACKIRFLKKTDQEFPPNEFNNIFFHFNKCFLNRGMLLLEGCCSLILDVNDSASHSTTKKPVIKIW